MNLLLAAAATGAAETAEAAAEAAGALDWRTQIIAMIVGALGGAGYGLVMYMKKAAKEGKTPDFDFGKLGLPVGVGAVVGLFSGFTGQDIDSFQDIFTIAATSGFTSAIVQLGKRGGGSMLNALWGRLKGKK